jgi:hypothetical protein
VLEVIDRIEEQGGSNGRRNIGDILCAIALIRDQIKIERVVIEEYQLQDFGVNDYLPFMNYLQHRDYATVRRYILIHSTEVSGGQWEVSGNGVRQIQVEAHVRSRCTRRSSLKNTFCISQSSVYYSLVVLLIKISGVQRAVKV